MDTRIDANKRASLARSKLITDYFLRSEERRPDLSRHQPIEQPLPFRPGSMAGGRIDVAG
jgi:hypothetical protein